MNRTEIAALERASRSVMAYDLGDDRQVQVVKLMTATVPALGIVAACALMLIAVL